MKGYLADEGFTIEDTYTLGYTSDPQTWDGLATYRAADSEAIVNTIDRDTCHTREDSLLEIYRKLRPGDPPTVETSEAMLDGLFFDRRRYDLSNVGRYKINKKLAAWSRIVGFKLAAPIADLQTGEIVAEAGQILTRDEAEAIGSRGLLDAYVFDEHGQTIRVFGNGMQRHGAHGSVRLLRSEGARRDRERPLAGSPAAP